MDAAAPAERRPSLEEIVVAGDPVRWGAAGFVVEGDVIRAGRVRVRIMPGSAGGGIVGWVLRDLATTDLDGLATRASEGSGTLGAEHPNTCVGVDHVVVLTPDLERTGAALAAAGAPFRRVREAGDGDRPLRQGFVRLGPAILEAVEAPDAPAGPASFWGVTFVVADLDRAGFLLGSRLGEAMDAVQPGRRIATVRRDAGLGLPVALITPEPARGG